VQAQGDNSLKGVPFQERIFTGGGLGMSFGSTQDYISISPVIGYKITEKFWGGTSFMWRYTKYKYIQPAVTLIDYGINPFLRYTIFNNVFIQTEYEYLNYEFPIDANTSVRETFNSFLAGGGFFQPFGNNAGFFMMALYNFSYSEPAVGEYAPYYSPWVIRAGINVGF
jgi:hypothetical protein